MIDRDGNEVTVGDFLVWRTANGPRKGMVVEKNGELYIQTVFAYLPSSVISCARKVDSNEWNNVVESKLPMKEEIR